MGAMLCCCRGGNMEKAMADAAAAAATGGNPRTNQLDGLVIIALGAEAV